MTEISISRIKAYKSCLRQYDLRYNCLLEEEHPTQALKTGKSYHEKLDEIIKTGDFGRTDDVTDVMAKAWMERVYPNLDLKVSEERFSVPLTDNVNLMGFIDGMTTDGIPVEHKTVGKPIDEKYKYNLAFDDQITAYMLATGTNQMIYTVCQKPTIKQRKNETTEEYEERLKKWYLDDKHLTYFKVVRSKEDLEQKHKEFQEIAEEMLNRKFFYPNPSACLILSCPYKDICLDYDPEIEDIPLGFMKKESR